MSALVLEGIVADRGAGHRRVHALRGVDLRLDPGEIVLLEGPSGSGKTTLLAVAAGLLTPVRGEVTLDGQRLGALSPAAVRDLRARRVGFVFQRANLLDRLDVHGNVVLAARLAGLHGAEADTRSAALLERLGIGPLARRRTDALSGGEEHRVAVARALVHDPAVIFADEPTASLDGQTGHAVAEALAALARDRGAAVLVATHDPRLERFATRRVRIVDGRLDG